MKWIDVNDIAIDLMEKFPEVDPRYVLFTDLHKWVTELENFEDEQNKSNEKILEAIQMAWIEELD
ncbi:MAG: Fe-S cluster assembly protein IscX [SAR86 cluster bacterium]|jgi:FeS assembly protein IscX|nr:Fe-S cluster assembly protein IscX [SAR86 cluster bacterium]|tara:strand:- start:1697 stop:1891 length:195 start_codon:yes stop_codon:yes gene_type:complete